MQDNSRIPSAGELIHSEHFARMGFWNKDVGAALKVKAVSKGSSF